MQRGLFITFEGAEGSGKSTQVKKLAEIFEQRGITHHATREPGGTTGALEIRKLLVESKANDYRWSPMTELLLFMAARVDHAEKVIQPKLAAGVHILCDRFFDSTLVYQGMCDRFVDGALVEGLGEEIVQSVQNLSVGNLKPDLTLILDIDPAQGIIRATSRAGGEKRFENISGGMNTDWDFHQAIREEFRNIAKRDSLRCVLIDASGSPEEVHHRIIAAVDERLGFNLRQQNAA